jgi:arylsulfatase A-like enzyme
MKMKQGIIFLFSAIFFMSSVKASDEVSKPNIIFIFADDMTYQTLGALNNPQIRTPNIDMLAQNGVCFTNAYIQGSWCPAVCVASRTMFVTGRYVWKAAQYNSKANYNPNGRYVPKKNPSYTVTRSKPSGYWPLLMKEGGYQTFIAGKWHVEEQPELLFDHLGTVRMG